MISLRQAETMRAELIAEHEHMLKALDTLIPFLRKRESVLGTPPNDGGGTMAAPLAMPPTPSLPLPQRPIGETIEITIFPEDWPRSYGSSSLRDFILSLAKFMPSRAWTSREMRDELVKRDVPIAGVSPDAQVNNVLSVLNIMASNNGPLIQTIKGVGRRPSQFKLRTAESEKEAAEATP